jgi:CRP-like cAMP-binding protein
MDATTHTDLVALSVLRNFSPLDGLKRENLGALARKTRLRDMPEGGILFRRGEEDRHCYFLVKGEVDLVDNGTVVATMVGGTAEARFALAEGKPRRFSAHARTALQYIAIDSEALDVLMTWDQTGIYEVEEITTTNEDAVGGDDWMTTLLQTKALHRIPPSHLQALFMRLQRLNLSAGEVLVRQGELGDYFYIIVSGRCAVTRETPLNREGIRLAELGPGDSFGEEALVADTERNATVRMLSDGAVMRLGKQDFQELLNEPMLQWANGGEAQALASAGAQLLDVRLPSEAQAQPVPGALNIPLYFMRLKLRQLDKGQSYVVVCDTGRRSSAGAFLLAERGFNAYVLRGGVAALLGL